MGKAAFGKGVGEEHPKMHPRTKKKVVPRIHEMMALSPVICIFTRSRSAASPQSSVTILTQGLLA